MRVSFTPQIAAIGLIKELPAADAAPHDDGGELPHL
jgi:hypothetical protein